MTDIPKEVKDAAQTVLDWLDSADAHAHCINIETVFFHETEASRKRLEKWLAEIEGKPGYITTEGFDATKGVMRYLARKETD